MQSQNRILDDIARAASGALGALGGLKTEIDQQVQALVERALRGQDLVTREEFEAVKEMAARARAEAEDLRARLDRLEAAAGAPPAPGSPPPSAG
jgi:BMFP domain-containing protein YqiC